MTDTMRAMVLHRTTSLDTDDAPLTLERRPIPEPGPGEVLVRVAACGVCHTELDEIEGRAPARLPVVPGHEIVGRVAALGAGAARWSIGDRVGVGWIHSSSGAADENLSPAFRATGRDVDGGYADYHVVDERYAVAIPDRLSDTSAAPLLCAGAVGWRALRLSGLRDGQRLGLTGFGGSAHLVLQLVRQLYPESPVHVFARDPEARRYALELGAVWAGDTAERAPQPLHAIIDTTPAWKPVVEALANLRPGGRLVINAISKEAGDREELLRLDYREHLWMEREIKSVANVTRRDVAELLELAGRLPIAPQVRRYPLEQANRALVELRREPIVGAKVLEIALD